MKLNGMLVVLVLVTIASFSRAQTPSQPASEHSGPKRTAAVELLEDLVSFAKVATILGGAFIAIFAFIGVAFFGFDVRNARAAIDDSSRALRGRVDEAGELHDQLRKDLAELAEKKDQFKAFINDAEAQRGVRHRIREPS